MNKIVPTAVCAAILSLGMLVPAAFAATYTSDNVAAMKALNGQIDNEPNSSFVNAQVGQQQIKSDWVNFWQTVQNAVQASSTGSANVDNTYICASIAANVWSWTALFANLHAAALCP